MIESSFVPSFEIRPSKQTPAARMAPDCAFVLDLIISVYQELLARIEACPDAVLRSDPMLSQADKAVLAGASARRTGYPLEKMAEKMAPSS